MKACQVKTAGRLAALAATTWVLVATSAPYDDPPTCLHVTERVTYEVGGTCGAPGVITVISEEDECAISVVGAAEVGLPSGGTFVVGAGENDTRLDRAPWVLSGNLTPPRRDGGWPDVVPPSTPDAGGGDASDGGGSDAGDGGGSDAGDGGVEVGPAAPEVAVVQPPPGRGPGLGASRACQAQIGANGAEALVCGPPGQNALAKPECTATLKRRP